mmetsp:Transcript_23665/g.23377  ORF Transcript_23665/g.23377 Transcript_23665/m.23377 type:complete len:146 (+) Transcript_23665:866-1303(+)
MRDKSEEKWHIPALDGKIPTSMQRLNTSSDTKMPRLKASRDIAEVKNKLAYEWKNIYRALLAQSSGLGGMLKGTEERNKVSLGVFAKVAHTNRVFLSKEELKKLQILYGEGNNETSGMIDFVRMGSDLGLHKNSLEFIRTKSHAF